MLYLHVTHNVLFCYFVQLFNELAASEELRLDYMLQPGEIQLLNNHTQLHARSEFVDYEDIDKRRHLLR